MLSLPLVFLSLAATVLGKVQFVGVNIAGFEFGCQIDGTCPIGTANPPLTSLGGGDGAGQMQHFTKDDGMNIFRLPVSWQWLVNNQLGGSLDSTNLGKYDQLVQACLATGAYCNIDIHNFARFNGGIIGQGGPTVDQFTDLWTQIATKYKSESKIIFGLMNEPHDLDIGIWANSAQAAVTAIRNAGATSQMITLPGTNFSSAYAFVSSGSGAALINIKNPDGSTDGLVLDIHKYFDVDNSGTHAACVTDNTAAFQTAADFLRSNGRQALVSETGSGHGSDCVTDFCAQSTLINANSDVFLGYIAWGAGSFDNAYVLSLTPTKKGNQYVDQDLLTQCVLTPWVNAPSVAPLPSTTSTTSSAAATSSSGSSSDTGSAAAASTTFVTSQGSSGVVSGSGSSTVGVSNTLGGSATAGSGTKPTGTNSGATATSSLVKSTSTSGAEALRYEGGLFFGTLLLAALL